MEKRNYLRRTYTIVRSQLYLASDRMKTLVDGQANSPWFSVEPAIHFSHFANVFRETRHEIRNAHYTLFAFHVNFIFYQCREKIKHEIIWLFAWMPTLAWNAKKWREIRAVYTYGCRLHLWLERGSRAVWGNDVIVSQLSRGSKFKPHLKFWANRVCFGHLWALLFALGGFSKKNSAVCVRTVNVNTFSTTVKDEISEGR